MNSSVTVSVTIEIHSRGTRTNIEKFTIPAFEFLKDSPEFLVNLNQSLARTTKELTNPTPKTDMA